MKRIDIIYGGQNYRVGGRDLDDLQNEISAGMTGHTSSWLKVNYGEGVPREAHLLLTPGVTLTIIPVPAAD